jgi:hypothetical protein
MQVGLARAYARQRIKNTLAKKELLKLMLVEQKLTRTTKICRSGDN